MSDSRRLSNSSGSEPKVPLGAKILIAAVLALILLPMFWFGFTQKVDAGNVCVVTKNGKVVDVADAGLHSTLPFVHKYHCFDARLQTYELVDGEPKDSNSKATYVDYNIDTHSVDGQNFSVTAIVQYHILGARAGESKDQIITMYKNGARSDERIFEVIVKSIIRGTIPQELNTYTANQLYTGELGSISGAIQTKLADQLLAKGVVLDTLQIKRPTFNQAYEEAIAKISSEAANAEAVKAQQETSRQQGLNANIQAEAAATVAETNAQTAAKQQQIAAEAQAQAAITAQEAQNQNTLSAAQAQSEANALIGETYNQYPALLDHERIGAITNANVIYLPNDVLGILDLGGTSGSTPTAP
jgi:regulator of protease activity HflC (stomatin/prohibitin superfamily)